MNERSPSGVGTRGGRAGAKGVTAGLIRSAVRAVAERLEPRWVISASPTAAAEHDDHDHENPYEVPAYLPAQTSLFRQDGFLSAGASGKPLVVARQFLRERAADFGVSAADIARSVVTDQYTDADTGVTHIYLRQKFGGLEIANANLSVHLTRDNRVLMAGGGFIGGLDTVLSNLPDTSPARSATQAIRDAAAHLDLPADVTLRQVKARAEGDVARRQSFRATGLSQDAVPAKLHYVATESGLALAWDLIVRTPDDKHWVNASINADTGEVVASKDWVSHAMYQVYAMPTEAPHDGPGNVGVRTNVTDPHDVTTSPFGWHDTNGVAGAEYTITRGNNVNAYLDRDNSNSPDVNGSPDGGAPLSFAHTLDLTQSPTALVSNQQAAVTNLFYWNNVLHDVHARYGFTEAAGNFQATNYSGQGAGNDAVAAEAQDGGGTNNANFATPPDGSTPRMQMYLFNRTTPGRDGDLDNQIIVHEYGHGVSNRLTGGPANSNALTATQSGGMGEGWSDWWGLMFTMKPTDGQMDRYPVGTYVNGQDRVTGAGIRRFPYSYDMAVDPLTFTYYNNDSSKQVHQTGEIWCSTLWDMTWLLINKHGYSNDITQGYAAGVSGRNGGNNLALKLVMDGLKLQPANPSFTQARDAILAADTALTGGANHLQIWQAFARRGLGFSSSTTSSNSGTVTVATDVPVALLNPRVLSVAPSTTQTTPVSSIDLTFTRAMDPATFSIVDDITSFTGPGGVNLLSQITGSSWSNGNQTLRITLVPQSIDGQYALTIGPNILSTGGTPMDQDSDGTPGEATQDQFVATFRYDSLVLAVSSTSPAVASTVALPMTTLDVTFNEPIDPASLAATDLTLSSGTVASVSVVNPTTARFTLNGLTTETSVTATIAAGAIADVAGGGSAAFSGVYHLDNATTRTLPAFVARNPVGSMVYSSQATGVLGALDTDSFVVALDEGQTLSLAVKPTEAAVRPSVTLRGPGGAVIATATASTLGSQAVLQTAPVATSGLYTIDVSAVAGADGYTLTALLNGALEAESIGVGQNDTPAGAQNVDAAFADVDGVIRTAVFGTSQSASLDHYAVTLAAGESLSASVAFISASTTNLRLLDGSGAVIGTTATGPTNVNRALADFVAPAAGTYLLEVSNSVSAGSEYVLTLLRNASFDLESNASTTTAQVVQSPLVGGSRRVAGAVASTSDVDTYRVVLAAGTPIVASTQTPIAGENQPVNTLNPRLRVLTSAGTQVALDDNSSVDARNAELSYTPPTAGVYYVEVTSSGSASSGEYVLWMSGMEAVAEFAVTTTTPGANSGVRPGTTSSITVNFNDDLLQSSVQAADLTIDGVPATAATVLSARSVRFDFPVLATEGTRSVAIAAGAILDLQATPIAAYASQLFVESVSPRVVSSSVVEGAVLPSGSYTQTITFNEPMMAGITSVDLRLRGTLRAIDYTPTVTFDAARTSLTLTHSNLPEDAYTLTLTSGDGAFEDDGGNNLDGETTWPLPTIGSGNGVEGGDFVVNFAVDLPTTSVLAGYSSVAPLGSLVHQITTTGVIHGAADEDVFSFVLQAGTSVTVVATGTGLQSKLSLVAPDGTTTVATATGAAVSAPVVLQSALITTAGIHTLRIGAVSGAGVYSLAVTYNALVETEEHGGMTNNSIATAQNIDGGFLTLAPGISRSSVLGRLPGTVGTPVISDGFEAGLGAAWTTSTSLPGGRVGVNNLYSAANGSFALHMDAGSTSTFVLNEAIWTVNLSGIVNPSLSFAQVSTGDDLHTLPTSFTGSSNGDGVSMSNDGITWYRIWDASNSTSSWSTIAINLTSAAQAAGITLGTTVRFKFQQYDDFAYSTDGRGWDDVAITTPSANDDYFAFSATAGERVSIATMRTGTTAGQRASLYNAAGDLLAVDVVGGTNIETSLDGYVVPATGTYYVGVTGATNPAYHLMVLKSAVFEREANESLATAMTLGSTANVVGYFDSGSDYFRVPVTAGVPLTVRTYTPFNATGIPSNFLNPRLELYNAFDVLAISDDNSAGDGVNALLTYTPSTSGYVKVRVASTSGSGGYVLSATGVGAVAIPAAPDLLAIADSGVSVTDNITSLNNSSTGRAMTFSVAGTVPGATVTLYAGGTAIGSAVATGSTTDIVTNGGLTLIDGVYQFTARQRLSGEAEGPDSIATSVTIDTTPPPTPDAPDLTAASDLGVSNTDNITSDNTPTLSIPVAPYYRLYDNGVKKGGDYNTATSHTTATLADGLHSLSVTSVDAAGNESAQGATLAVTIDTVGPIAIAAVPNVAAAGGTSQTFSVTYADSSGVDASSIGAAQLRAVSPIGTPYAATFLSVDSPSNGSPRVATYSFFPPGGSWDSGDNGPWTISLQSFPPRDIAGVVSTTGTIGSFQVAIASVPLTPDLVSASDTGVADFDNVTRLNNAASHSVLQFSVSNVMPGGTVEILVDGMVVGAAVSTGTTTIVTADGVTAIADGARSVVARHTLSNGSSATSGALTLAIDSVAPTTPIAPDLVEAYDTGASRTDDITQRTTVNFRGNPAPYKRVYVDGLLQGPSYDQSSTQSATLLPNTTHQVTQTAVDAAGNESPHSPALAVTNDVLPPTAAATWENLTTPAAAYRMVVTYSDAFGIDVTTLNSADLLVTGPSAFSDIPSLVSVDNPTHGSPRVATYELVTTSGQWTSAHNGVYTVSTVADRVFDVAGNYVQSGMLGTFQVAIPIATPGSLDLSAIHDSGVLNTDNITSRNNASAGSTLEFTINGTITGATVALLADGVEIGSAVAAGSTVVVTTNGTLALADGVRNFTARQTLSGYPTSLPSAPLAVTIDTAAPRITRWQSARTHARGVGEVGLDIADDGTFVEARTGTATLLVTLDQDIDPTSLLPASVGVWGTGSNNLPLNLASVVVSTALRTGGPSPVVEITLAGLPDAARYLVRLSGLRDMAGNILAGDNDRVFTQLRGDVTGDRRVNNTDVGGVISLRGTDPISASVLNQVRSDVTLDGRINNTDVGGVTSARGLDIRFLTDPVAN